MKSRGEARKRCELFREFEATFDGFALQAEFAPFVDEAACLDNPAAGGDFELGAFPPYAADGDDGIEAALVPKSEG